MQIRPIKHTDMYAKNINHWLQIILITIAVFNDGSQKDLVQLDGTIPVNYRGMVVSPTFPCLLHVKMKDME